MKNIILHSCLCFSFVFIVSSAYSQDIRIQACNSESITHQADSIKQAFTTNGYIVLKEASITMESEYEMPVIVPLTAGSWYQFVFIGDNSSKLLEVRMYDWDEKEVVYQKNKGNDGNIISYGYVPNISEYHMIKPLQVNKQKKKGLCGYVILLKRTK